MDIDQDLDQYRSFPYDGNVGDGVTGPEDQAASLVDEVYNLFAESPELGLLAKKTGFANNGQIEDLTKSAGKGPASAGHRNSTAGKTNFFSSLNGPASRSQATRSRTSDEGAAAVLSSLPSSPTKLAASPSAASSAAALLVAAAAAAEDPTEIKPDPGKRVSARRKRDDEEDLTLLEDEPASKRRKASASTPVTRYGGSMDSAYHDVDIRGGDKNKGLRLFSKVVCDKVMTKGITSYNEVADELVTDYTQAAINEGNENPVVDQKNIRRRVYDALNVLMAMNIISKEKKEIRWIGLPPTSPRDELRTLTQDRVQLVERIKRKREQLQDLQAQYDLYSKLIKRNSSSGNEDQERILVPFIIVHTGKQTHIDCDVSDDYTEYLMRFEHPFSIHDDNEILRRVLKPEDPLPLPRGAKATPPATAVASSSSSPTPAQAQMSHTDASPTSKNRRSTRRNPDVEPSE